MWFYFFGAFPLFIFNLAFVVWVLRGLKLSEQLRPHLFEYFLNVVAALLMIYSTKSLRKETIRQIDMIPHLILSVYFLITIMFISAETNSAALALYWFCALITLAAFIATITRIKDSNLINKRGDVV